MPIPIVAPSNTVRKRSSLTCRACCACFLPSAAASRISSCSRSALLQRCTEPLGDPGHKRSPPRLDLIDVASAFSVGVTRRPASSSIPGVGLAIEENGHRLGQGSRVGEVCVDQCGSYLDADGPGSSNGFTYRGDEAVHEGQQQLLDLVRPERYITGPRDGMGPPRREHREIPRLLPALLTSADPLGHSV